MNTNLPWNSPTQLGIDDAKGGIHQRYTIFESPRYAVAYTTESTYLDAQEGDIDYIHYLTWTPLTPLQTLTRTLDEGNSTLQDYNSVY